MSERELQTGIVGTPLVKERREVPDTAPAIWGPSEELRQVGKPLSRLDALEKVTGRARYTTDVQLPGMLYGKVLRSPYPHARIRGIDASAAQSAEGVRAVVVLPHLVGGAKEQGEEAPFVARYAGQPICAVAAVSPALAEAALSKIKVAYEPLPFVVDPDAAAKDGAPLVFAKKVTMAGSAGGGGAGGEMTQKGNLRGPKKGGGQDPEAAKAKVAQILATSGMVIVKGNYRTQVQTHSALEPHGLCASWQGGELTVWASTQGIYSVRDELAEYLGIDRSKIRVHTDYCGGGFGAKFGAGNYGVLAALLAQKAGAPVRIVLSRKEEHLAVGNRPGSKQEVTLAADKEGKLQAIQVLGQGFGGAGAGAGFAGPAQNLYNCPNIYTEETDVFTHTGPLAAFRAPGHPQGAFALEQAMDELAERLGLDPLLLRDRNDLHPARKEERARGAKAIGWHNRHPAGKGPLEQGALRRGLGMAQGLWYHLINLNSNAEVRIHKDGAVELFTGVQDIGGGIRTPLAQVVAEELQIEPAKVKVHIGDTNFPVGPASGGSVTTASITPAARDAAYAAKKALIEAAVAQGVPADRAAKIPLFALAQKMRKEVVSGSAERMADYGGFKRRSGSSRGDARGVGYGQLGGVHFVEVEVDTKTGLVRVLRVVAAQDCGRPLNPLLTESQVKGGVIQGISYALFEERRMDRRTGLMVNPNLEQYKIAGALDTPAIEVILLQELRGRSSTDAGGIGEPATVPTAAALANAVYNAIGVRIYDLPITPRKVLAALAAANRRGS